MCPERSRFIAIARILRPQGRRGEVSAEIITDFPDRFQKLSRVFLGGDAASDEPSEPDGSEGLKGFGDSPRQFTLERTWPHKGRMILKLGGIDSIDQAESLRGLVVFIPFEERVPLPANTYYWPDLEGCRVLTGPAEARIEVGTVAAIEPTSGVPILHVSHKSPGHEEILIPFAQEICREINPKAKLIVIDPPEDLLELNEPEWDVGK
ncbi:MAG: ribosome maturation factor RimM [Terriglobia bacterium]